MSAIPNIVFIMTDQQNTNTLGCYGNPIIHTPNIDRLALEGTLFQRHYVTAPLCVPSRASIWSSRYPHSNGVMVNDDDRTVSLPDDLPTFGDLAKKMGYLCGYIGKWHVGRENIAQHGFTDAWWTHLRGSYEQSLEEAGFDFPPDSDRGSQRGMVPYELTHDTVVAAKTIEFIKEHCDNPFAVVCSMRAPHDPYTGPFNELYDPADIPLPATFMEDFQGKPYAQQRGAPRAWFEHWIGTDPDHYNTDELRRITARYWGLTHLIDLNVGRVLQCLDDLNLAENTIVVFMADHGDMMGEHGLFAKGLFMYEGSIHVPCIVRWPGHIPAGRRVNYLSSTIDIVPTLLDLMGIPLSQGMQGESMRSLWDHASNHRDAIFAEIWEAYGCSSPILSIRTERWKYNWYLADRDELYDLEADPLEMNNLAPLQKHRETLLGLRSRIEKWLMETGDVTLSRICHIPPGKDAQ
jgi:choline-sulfatase